jgi:hypothetical protein
VGRIRGHPKGRNKNSPAAHKVAGLQISIDYIHPIHHAPDVDVDVVGGTVVLVPVL